MPAFRAAAVNVGMTFDVKSPFTALFSLANSRRAVEGGGQFLGWANGSELRRSALVSCEVASAASHAFSSATDLAGWTQ